MSEKANDSPPASEPVEPAPPAKGGNKTWVAIVAVIVVVALILAGLWAAGIIFGDEEGALEATIDPSPVVVNAGSDVELTVNPTWDGDALTSGVTYKWSATPTTLGSFDLTRQRTVTYTAGNSAGTGTVSCEVTYVDSDDKTYTKVVTASLTVNPAVLDTVVLVPSVRTLEPGMSQEFLASAYNSVGEELPNATIAWTVWNLTSSQYTLNATTGHSVMFTAVDFGGGRLNASATDSTGSAVGTAVINIVPDLPARNSTIKWYDMFAIPNEGFWDLRWDVTKLDEPLTDTYPYLYRWYGSQEGNSWIYTSMRMNVTGRNMYEVNMNGNPTFLPMLGNYRGGTADIRWYGNYMNMDETTRYPDFIGSQIDGWIWIMNGTVTLDKDAARTVLGIGASDFDSDFNGWWAANAEGFKLDYTNWLNYEGKVRIDIYNSYEYPFTLMYLDMTAAKVGDKVVLTYDTVSWGIDVLIAMQMWDAGVLDTYWYYEDFWFNATIGPEKMDLNLDTGVEYAVYAYETTLESEPCWEWEALVQDVLPKSAEHPRSNYTPYANLEYEMKSPGSDLYGQWLTYDYAPSAWNLTENETLIVEWPQGDVMFVKHGGTFFNTTQLYGQMEMRHSEPMDAAGLDMPPGKFAINNVTNQVIFQGPFNMWQWSKDQTHNQNLKDEWDRLGVLPYGIPTIELALKIDVPKYPDYMTIEGIPSLVDTNTATDFTVKVWDQFSNPYPFYNGTVRFFTNDSAAVLPGDYTFSNAGEASFSVVFNTPGYMNLTVVDIANASIDGNVDLQVGPEATSMVFLAVPYNAQTYMPFSLRVTVYDQFGNVFSNYTGQVNFTTTDTGGSVMLPADYTFTAGDAGTHLFAHGFVLETIGWQDIVVVDLADSLLTATLTIEVISAYPASKDFTVYDMFEEPWGWWWPIRWDFYITDIVITDEPHMNTMLFMPGKTDQYQCMMYAPYRFAVDALNQSLMSVDTPVMMPMFGSVVDGASVDMGIYFQYLEPTWWWDYWVPNWVSIPGGIDEEWLNRSGADGYDLGTVYTVEMNREAAEQWMGMPQTDDVATWWASNNATYTGDWEAWVDDQGNNVYDIFCGYEWAYDINGGTWMNLVEDGATGNVTLTIAHIALGFEILMTRWMSAAELSPLEPYYEDFTLHAQYSKYVTNVSTDGVAQYSLHAVKANKTATDGGAWVWEPAKIDYITKIGHPSDYRPYSTKMYQSWNAGDTFLGQQISYEQTPTWFNLTDGDSLTIQLPTGTVPGYKGVALTSTDIDNAAVGDKSGIYAIMQNGTMDLGYFVTDWPLGSGLDLTPLYNAGTKTLTIAGPQDFNNFWHTPTGILYHGAPWIEFNVTPLKAAAASVPEVSSGGVVSSSASSEMMSLAVVAAATILAVAALGACARRKY